jgi:hypothetical protein
MLAVPYDKTKAVFDAHRFVEAGVRRASMCRTHRDQLLYAALMWHPSCNSPSREEFSSGKGVMYGAREVDGHRRRRDRPCGDGCLGLSYDI